MELLFLLWIVCGIGAGVVASNRGANGCLWFSLGVLLGPIGLAISFTAGEAPTAPAARSTASPAGNPRGSYRCQTCKTPVIPGQSVCGGCGDNVSWPAGVKAEVKKCPDCAELIKADARKCRFCGCQCDARTAPELDPPKIWP